MNVFDVSRTDKVSWCQDYRMIVVACDAMWAEKLARLSSDDFRKAKLKVKRIDLNKEQILSTENTGA